VAKIFKILGGFINLLGVLCDLAVFAVQPQFEPQMKGMKTDFSSFFMPNEQKIVVRI